MPIAETAHLSRFAAYVKELAATLGHRDRHEPLRAHVTGLCLPGERKSVEAMAARVDPRHVRSRHPSMHHFVADAPWDAAAVLRVARQWVLEPMARHGGVATWIVDDTAFPKKGQHSVGVAPVLWDPRQAGQLSGGRERVDGERGREAAGGVSAPARGLGE
jgi:SRSO17 transposase